MRPTRFARPTSIVLVALAGALGCSDSSTAPPTLILGTILAPLDVPESVASDQSIAAHFRFTAPGCSTFSAIGVTRVASEVTIAAFFLTPSSPVPCPIAAVAHDTTLQIAPPFSGTVTLRFREPVGADSVRTVTVR